MSKKAIKMSAQHKTYPFWLSIPALSVYTIFVIVPIGMSLVLSFTDWNIRRWDDPKFAGLQAFKEVIKDPDFGRAVFNTFLFAVLTTILKIGLGLILALVLYKSFKANSIFRTIFYLPCVLSMTVIGVLFTSILAKNGLLNNILNLLGLTTWQREWLGQYTTSMAWVIIIESWMWAGFNMFIFISGLQAIPRDYYEAASTEGASSWKQFTKITLPLLVPAITVNATMNIAGGMKVFDIIYILMKGGQSTDTQVLSTYAFKSFSVGYLGESSAASIILTVLVILVSFLLNYFFRKREVEV
ncbi:sugar ABC transporter permease [Muricomes intestini]|jgi:raffinose/stachyose/melibiose transport system permease protein|uniref:carbohydrate ABC transporter permease n=1 Tax=Muricomes intestini TaxID=1796634 RepID=UPI002696F19A